MTPFETYIRFIFCLLLDFLMDPRAIFMSGRMDVDKFAETNLREIID
jgi:hypothetical protein